MPDFRKKTLVLCSSKCRIYDNADLVCRLNSHGGGDDDDYDDDDTMTDSDDSNNM